MIGEGKPVSIYLTVGAAVVPGPVSVRGLQLAIVSRANTPPPVPGLAMPKALLIVLTSRSSTVSVGGIGCAACVVVLRAGAYVVSGMAKVLRGHMPVFQKAAMIVVEENARVRALW